MTKKYTLEEISKLLVECAQGEADAERVASELSHLKFENEAKVANFAIHFLHHFYADADLRSKDKEYDEHMKEKLLSYASQLEGIRGH